MQWDRPQRSRANTRYFNGLATVAKLWRRCVEGQRARKMAGLGEGCGDVGPFWTIYQALSKSSFEHFTTCCSVSRRQRLSSPGFRRFNDQVILLPFPRLEYPAGPSRSEGCFKWPIYAIVTSRINSTPTRQRIDVWKLSSISRTDGLRQLLGGFCHIALAIP